MAGGFYPQDAEAGVLIEVRNTLDEAGDAI
jgi:hypothetical protein